MRMLKLALISVVLLFLVWTAIAFLIPSKVRISRATNIAARSENILGLVNDSAQWPRWHPWFSDTAVDLKKVRFQWIERSDSLTRVRLQHPGARDLDNNFRIHRLGGDSLTLQWYSDFHFRWYPWEKFSSLFLEGTYGSLMEQGIGRLREEAQQEKP